MDDFLCGKESKPTTLLLSTTIMIQGQGWNYYTISSIDHFLCEKGSRLKIPTSPTGIVIQDQESGFVASMDYF